MTETNPENEKMNESAKMTENKGMSRPMKVILIIIFIIVAAAVVFRIFEGQIINHAKSLTIEEIPYEQMKDGVYEGAYKITPVSVSLKTTVKDHKITAIDIIEHFNGLGSKAEAIINKMIEAQTIDVDSISGATVSSVAIKKAVEDSLHKAIQ